MKINKCIACQVVQRTGNQSKEKRVRVFHLEYQVVGKTFSNKVNFEHKPKEARERTL